MTSHRNVTVRDPDSRHFAALERIARRLASIEPEDPSEESERRKGRLLVLRAFYRARLGIDDDQGESRALVDWRVAATDSCLARVRRVCGLPPEGPVDWAAVRARVSAMGAGERSDIFDD